MRNRYPGRCWRCGRLLGPGEGRLFKVAPDEAEFFGGKSGWVVECLDEEVCQERIRSGEPEREEARRQARMELDEMGLSLQRMRVVGSQSGLPWAPMDWRHHRADYKVKRILEDDGRARVLVLIAPDGTECWAAEYSDQKRYQQLLREADDPRARPEYLDDAPESADLLLKPLSSEDLPPEDSELPF